MAATSPLLTLEQTADHLQVPPRTVYNWRTRGLGPRGIRVGRHVRYRLADVDAWLDGLADQQHPDPPPRPVVMRRRRGNRR